LYRGRVCIARWLEFCQGFFSYHLRVLPIFMVGALTPARRFLA
jgi:hypothetical protein